MKRTFKVAGLLVILILGLSFFVGCGGGDGNEKVVFTYGGIQSSEDLATKSMEMMADLVKEKSNGTIEIEVYPAAQLGDAVSQIEAVMIGSQDMFIDASSFVAQFVPDKQVDSLFFAFLDEDHFVKYLNSDVMTEIEDKFLNDRGVRTLAQNYLRAPRVLVSKKPVLSIDDMKGLKMRVPEITTYLESVKALGASPTQVPWGETYLALSQGVVQAAESPFDAVYTMKFFEGAPNITMTNHIRDNLAVMINESKFQKLSESQQKALQDAAMEAGNWYTEQVKLRIDDVKEKMENEGASFHEIDIDPFVEIMFNTADELEASGMWSNGLFEKIQSLK